MPEPIAPLSLVAALALGIVTMFFTAVFLFGVLCVVGGAGDPALPFIGVGACLGLVSAWLFLRVVRSMRRA